jgi:hypothetical protein
VQPRDPRRAPALLVVHPDGPRDAGAVDDHVRRRALCLSPTRARLFRHESDHGRRRQSRPTRLVRRQSLSPSITPPGANSPLACSRDAGKESANAVRLDAFTGGSRANTGGSGAADGVARLACVLRSITARRSSVDALPAAVRRAGCRCDQLVDAPAIPGCPCGRCRCQPTDALATQ